jgi:hypothetical protein
MMLEQINRRLAEKAAAMKGKKMREAPAQGSFKTIGIRVDAETYESLLAFMKAHKISSVKAAAVEAVKLGLR